MSEFTSEQVLAAISDALKASDVPLATSLIHYLALIDPAAASAILDFIKLGRPAAAAGDQP